MSKGGGAQKVRILPFPFSRTFQTFRKFYPKNVFPQFVADFSQCRVLCFFFVWWPRCTVFVRSVPKKTQKSKFLLTKSTLRLVGLKSVCIQVEKNAVERILKNIGPSSR